MQKRSKVFVLAPLALSALPLFWFACSSTTTTPGETIAAAPSTEALQPGFQQTLQPFVAKYCIECHSGAKPKAELDLSKYDSFAAIAKDANRWHQVLERVKAKEMPPGESKLSEAEIGLLERWIAAGAPTARPEPEQISPGIGITPEEREWWAFRPIARPKLVHSGDTTVRTPIDALLKQAMPEGLHFTTDADRLTLLKRATLDLTGLPPTAEQIQRFVTSEAPDPRTARSR